MDEVKDHWRNQAVAFGGLLGATTKASTPKALELDALIRRFRSLLGEDAAGTILEVGCGNGVNCLELASVFPGLTFDGVDYVDEMIGAAEQLRSGSSAADRLRFLVGDALAVDALDGLAPAYDIVFTDRCLINLPSTDQQKQAITGLASKVRPGGHLVMIENSRATYDTQNRYREHLGLPPRSPATFNLFFDETEILPHLPTAGLELVDTEDFISLHDLVLYVLVPAINGGTVDYNHPLVEAATMLNLAVSATTPSAFGAYGQNRLYTCRRTGNPFGNSP